VWYANGMIIALTCAAILAAGTDATRFARVVPADPSRPHLDLGPVLVREGVRPASERDILRELDVVGRELGADGFIYDGRDVREIYLIGADKPAANAIAFTAGVLLLAMIGHGGYVSNGQPSSVSVTSGYRAFRYVGEAPAKMDVANAPLVASLKQALGEASDLGAQLMQAHRWLFEGKLEVRDYTALRRFLTAMPS
jgi:hypothetical protein